MSHRVHIILSIPNRVLPAPTVRSLVLLTLMPGAGFEQTKVVHRRSAPSSSDNGK